MNPYNTPKALVIVINKFTSVRWIGAKKTCNNCLRFNRSETNLIHYDADATEKTVTHCLASHCDGEPKAASPLKSI